MPLGVDRCGEFMGGAGDDIVIDGGGMIGVIWGDGVMIME